MVELKTFGEIHLRAGGITSRSVLEHPKRFALFVYLVSADVTAHQRDQLMAMFWPELNTERAQTALRKALHYIRAEMGEAMIINRGKDAVVVDRSSLRCDATALDVAFDAGEDDIVLRLYSGEFLPSFHIDDAPEFENWLDGQRQHYLEMAIKSALRIARTRAMRDQPDEAAEALRVAVRLAPYNALIVKSAVELMMRAGYKFYAIKTYTDFAKRLEEDLEDPRAAAAIYQEAEKMWEGLESDLADEKAAVKAKLDELLRTVRIA